MKSLLFALLFATFCAGAQANNLISDEYKVIFSETKIWIMADETPVTRLNVQVKDANGKVILEKNLSSKCSDWSLSVDDLKSGKYSLWIAGAHRTDFKR
jgi:hypothetical protein